MYCDLCITTNSHANQQQPEHTPARKMSRDFPTSPHQNNQLLKKQQYFCLPEVWAMVVAVQQPSVECFAIFTVCIVQHRPPPCAKTTHKTCTAQRLNRYQDSAPSKTKGKCAGNTTNTLILANRPRSNAPFSRNAIHFKSKNELCHLVEVSTVDHKDDVQQELRTKGNWTNTALHRQSVKPRD